MIRVVRRRTKRESLEQYEKREGTEKLKSEGMEATTSDSLRLFVADRLLCPWESPGKNTRVGCHALLQGISPTQGSNSCLIGRQVLYH